MTKITTQLLFIGEIPAIVYSIASQPRIHAASIAASDGFRWTAYIEGVYV